MTFSDHLEKISDAAAKVYSRARAAEVHSRVANEMMELASAISDAKVAAADSSADNVAGAPVDTKTTAKTA